MTRAKERSGVIETEEELRGLSRTWIESIVTRENKKRKENMQGVVALAIEKT